MNRLSLLKKYTFAVAFILCASAAVAASPDKLRNQPKFDDLEARVYLAAKEVPNYREEMRKLVIALAKYAKGFNPNFIILPREGTNLMYSGKWEKVYDNVRKANSENIYSKDASLLQEIFNGKSNEEPEIDVAIGTPWRRYLNAIDGIILNGVYCQDNLLADNFKAFLKNKKIKMLGVEHCASENLRQNAFNLSRDDNVVLSADIDEKDVFDKIPKTEPFGANPDNIKYLGDVKNMLILTDTQNYGNKGEWIEAMKNTNEDMIVINPFFNRNQPLSKEDVRALRLKRIGTERLVLGYLNISEIGDRNFFWKEDWDLYDPAWLKFLSKTSPNQIITQYWSPGWKDVLGRYFQTFIELGFDGVVFDGLDNHMVFEELVPID